MSYNMLYIVQLAVFFFLPWYSVAFSDLMKLLLVRIVVKIQDNVCSSSYILPDVAITVKSSCSLMTCL